MLIPFILLFQAAQIVEPYTFREDQGQATKVILKNGLTLIVRENQHQAWQAQKGPLPRVRSAARDGYVRPLHQVRQIGPMRLQRDGYRGAIHRRA